MQTGSFGSAVGWSFVLSAGRQGFGFVITLVLAAVLGPTAYGTVAMAWVFIGFTQMFLVQGLMPALIQRKDLTVSQLSSVFWFSLAASGCLALLCIALSGWWADVNQLPDLQGVIVALSAILPISGLMVVQEAWLRRHLQFKRLAVRENVSVVVGGLAGIVSAVMGAGVWALVIQQVTTQTISVAVLWRVSDWRPRLHMAVSEVRDLLPFTASSSASAMGTFVNTQGDALIIGVVFGPQVVGLYRFASRIVLTVVEVLARSLQAVSLPELSRLQNDADALRNRLGDLVSLAARAAIPLLAVVAAVAPWFVPMVGDEWQPSTGALMILCGAGVMRVFSTFSGPLLQALNRPGRLAILVWLSAALSAGLLLVASALLEGSSVSRTVTGMAVATFVLFLFLVAVNSWIMRRFAGLPVGQQFSLVRVPLLSGVLALAAGGIVWFSGVTEGRSPLYGLVVAGVLATVAAGGTELLLDARMRRDLARIGGRARSMRTGARSRGVS